MKMNYLHYLLGVSFLLGLPFMAWTQRSAPPPSPNRNRTSGKFCTEEIRVWQEARWEQLDGKKYWAPAQWVVKQIEFPCDQQPRGARGGTPPPQSQPPVMPAQPVYSVGECFEPTLNPMAFQNALESIRKTSFNETKLTIAKQIIQNNCFLIPQVKDLIREFSFEESRLEIAKFAYDFTCDKHNYFQVNEVFQFETTVQQLDQFLKTKPAPNATPPPNFQRGGNAVCARPMMNDIAFRQLAQQVKNSTADATRLSLAKQGVSSFCVSAEQVKALASELIQELNRLNFLKYAFSYTYDPQNYIIVHEVLNSNVSKQDLSKFVQQQNQNR